MLTIKQTAKKLNVHWQTVRNYIDRGDLKAYKIGKLIKIKEEDLEEFINKEEGIENKDINVEVELRYMLKDPKKLEKKLLNIGAKVTYHSHIIDHWFIPIYIKTRKQHDEWFDQMRGCGIRIREQDNNYTGKIITSLETKRLTKSMNHNTFLESELNIDNYKKGKTFLEMLDRKEFLTIDKSRTMYSYNNFKISIDTIKNFKTGVEIEITKEKSRDKAIKKIENLANKLGLKKADQEEKSITVRAMKTLAVFS